MTAETESESSAPAATASLAVNSLHLEAGPDDNAVVSESYHRRTPLNRQRTPDSVVTQAHDTTSEESESEDSSEVSDSNPEIVSDEWEQFEKSEPQITVTAQGGLHGIREQEITPMADPAGQNGTAKTISWALSVTYVAFFVYVQLILQAGFTTISFLVAPLAYLQGGNKSWWDFVDTLYDLHERVIILLGIALKGTKLYFYGDFNEVQAKQESCIVICNHQVEGDYFVMAAAMEKTGKLARLRHVMKDSLIWIPYVGSFLIRRGSFFINRNNLDWSSFDENCRRLREDKVPTCILIYPEGTTMNNAIETPNIIEKSRQVAIENKQKPFEYVLFPRSRGFHRLLDKFRGQIDAIYDLTLIYSSTRDRNGHRRPAPCVTELANGYCPEIHINLHRIDIKDVPENEEDVKQFLFNQFVVKDRLLKTFYSTGSLPKKGVQLPSQSQRHLIQTSLVVLIGIWLGFTSTGLALLPYHLLVPGTIGFLHVAYHVYFAR
ncbi:1-acyl-sn-glycerol-3-phosphate acyltransferase epsilon-like [Varroa jacobsoni]|uniref:1-acyl-sn-glycerol-3-phosphate acyltransferase epsilon-like n=1 Tax=Varroa jacobsoni TaxID=62625 RepID=UPI000BFA2EF6|nr:1-acyl-sn-glycerol-3-phosphate acyltransferase epsilon-like [Varroa jacobsoni]